MLNKSQAKSIASDALAEGRVMDAVLVLTEAMPLRRALEYLEPEPQPKVGDILVSSWGYEQTNVDFYLVVGVTKSSVRLCKIGKRYVGSSQYHDDVVANPDHTFGEPMTKRIQKSFAGYCVKVASYSNAHLWDGKPQHQTGAGLGH